MRRLEMSVPQIVKDNEINPAVVFDVPPQGGARIGESDQLQLNKLCDRVLKRLQQPVIVSIRPHRVGVRNCLSIHMGDNEGKGLDLLITLTGNTVWPDEDEYARGARWYINLPDATDMMWTLKTLENISVKNV